METVDLNCTNIRVKIVVKDHPHRVKKLAIIPSSKVKNNNQNNFNSP